jgi:hypothetical protein
VVTSTSTKARIIQTAITQDQILDVQLNYLLAAAVLPICLTTERKNNGQNNIQNAAVNAAT